MRSMITGTLIGQIVLSCTMVILTLIGAFSETMAFAAFVIWLIGVFAMAGLTLGNLNAMALEPVGHIAGMAASVTGAISTVLAVALAAPLGLAFDGTYLPITAGVALMAMLALGLMLTIPRSKI